MTTQQKTKVKVKDSHWTGMGSQQGSLDEIVGDYAYIFFADGSYGRILAASIDFI